MTRSRAGAAWALVVLGLAVAVVGTIRVASATEPPQTGAVPAAMSSAPAPPVVPNHERGADPVGIGLPSQDVAAAVVPVGVEPDGSLEIPESPAVLGWWEGGARPGASEGTAVLAGHVDSRAYGPGALFRLAELEVGAPVSVTTADGVRAYEVRAVRSHLKDDLPAEVFARTGEPRLVLISCGGGFDDGHYTHNIVAYAVPVDAS